MYMKEQEEFAVDNEMIVPILLKNFPLELWGYYTIDI